MSAIYIRLFKPSDFAQLINLEREAFQETNPYVYTNLYESCPNGFLVAEKDGLVIGYVVGLLTDDHEGRIFSFAVNKRHRRSGIGTELLNAIFTIFRDNEIFKVRLEVRQSNEAARSLYRKLGFNVTGFIPRYYSDGEDAIVMKKTLR
ncbi:MAG: ribosomal protein S18-alanine N-acetyltransferase [Halobacteriota archaeon]|nr:ribosomal protein S18-alanine N-acetyltransferase [Halobacteriota archaeon]